MIFAFLIFFIFNQTTLVAYATPESNSYGKVLDNCKLYLNLSLNSDECLFIIPESYFVVVLDDVNNQCYKVQYKKYIGYVLKEKISICSFIPTVKYLDGVTFDIKPSSGTQIWSRPTDLSKPVTIISAGTCDIDYIASIYGDIPSGGVSNLWYYVTYTSNEFSTNVYEGYIYSENTLNLSTIPVNLENNNGDGVTEKSKNLLISSGTLKTIIISIIAIPIILFLVFILYKIIKIIQKNTNKTKISDNCCEAKTVGMIRSENDSLKNELHKLKNEEFVRKKKVNKLNEYGYPKFPVYENDDDWLWFCP